MIPWGGGVHARPLPLPHPPWGSFLCQRGVFLLWTFHPQRFDQALLPVLGIKVLSLKLWNYILILSVLLSSSPTAVSLSTLPKMCPALGRAPWLRTTGLVTGEKAGDWLKETPGFWKSCDAKNSWDDFEEGERALQASVTPAITVQPQLSHWLSRLHMGNMKLCCWWWWWRWW